MLAWAYREEGKKDGGDDGGRYGDGDVEKGRTIAERKVFFFFFCFFYAPLHCQSPTNKNKPKKKKKSVAVLLSLHRLEPGAPGGKGFFCIIV